MRKILKIMTPTLVLLLGLASLAQASFWVKGGGFHYSPFSAISWSAPSEYGRIHYDTPEKLDYGTGTAFSLGYDFSESWGVRLDTFRFNGEAEYYHKPLGDLVEIYEEIYRFEISTSPVLLSLVYRIPTEGKLRPYLGAGVGGFPSELTIGSNLQKEVHYKESSTGFQAFLGAEYRLKRGLFFSGELRYLSAEAEYPDYGCLHDCRTDWTGIFLALGVGYRFGTQVFKEPSI